MEAIKDFLGSLMLRELFKGLALTGRYMFSRKITVQFPEEKTPMSPRFRGLHALRPIRTVKSGVLPASCARQYVPRWRLASSPSSAMTALVAPRVTTSI